MTHLPFRSWCTHCIMEERTRRRPSQVDGGRAASSGSALGLHVQVRREGREDVGIHGCKRKRDKSCAQYGGSEEDDGRMYWPKTDSVASRDWTGVCGHHREVRQRTSVDNFDCVMEHDEGNDERIKDDHRGQSSWQFEHQRNCREGDPVGAGDDQDDSQRHRRTVGSEG